MPHVAGCRSVVAHWFPGRADFPLVAAPGFSDLESLFGGKQNADASEELPYGRTISVLVDGILGFKAEIHITPRCNFNTLPNPKPNGISLTCGASKFKFQIPSLLLDRLAPWMLCWHMFLSFSSRFADQFFVAGLDHRATPRIGFVEQIFKEIAISVLVENQFADMR